MASVAVGIDRIAVAPGRCVLDMATLVRARGGDDAAVAQTCEGMDILARGVDPAWEDPVTLAVRAVRRLRLDPAARSRVGLLLVGTESAPDQEKALSTWVQHYADLPDQVCNLELKHACYAGRGALLLAAAWVQAQPDPDATAIVVTTDQSRAHFGRPWEMVMGCGAVAFTVRREPGFLGLEPYSGRFVQDVSDLTRPTSRVEAGHSETSLLSYMEGVDHAFARFRAALGAHDFSDGEGFRRFLPHLVYHAPFGGITRRAHAAVWRAVDGTSRRAAGADYDARVASSLTYSRQLGGTYASSIFFSLLGRVDHLRAQGHDPAGERVGVYSYGSGSTAEFWCARFGPLAADRAREADVPALLAARRPLTVAEYEALEQARLDAIDEGNHTVPLDVLGPGSDADLRAATPEPGPVLCFQGTRDYIRQYAWVSP